MTGWWGVAGGKGWVREPGTGLDQSPPAVLERPRFIPSFFSSPLLLPPTVNAALNSEIAGRKLIAANLRRVTQVTAECRGS